MTPVSDYLKLSYLFFLVFIQ